MKEVPMVQELDVHHLAQLIVGMNAHGLDLLQQVPAIVGKNAEMVSLIVGKLAI